MAIEELLKIVAPPENPLEAGPAKAWNEIHKKVGTKLPEDLRDFGLHYGTGMIKTPAVGIRIMNPFSKSYPDQLRDVTEMWRSLKENEGDAEVSLPVFPDSPGLLPWGDDENGDSFFWFTEGKPNDWPVVVRPHSSVDAAYWRINLSLTSYLAKALARRIPTPNWEYDYFQPQTEIRFEPLVVKPPQEWQSVYELYIQNGNRAGFWIHRINWQRTLAYVRSIGGQEQGTLSGEPPEYDGAQIRVDIYDDGTIFEQDVELERGAAAGFEMIPTPHWAAR